MVRALQPEPAHTDVGQEGSVPLQMNTIDGRAYDQNLNFDTAADVGITSNYGLLHHPQACHQVVKGIGDTGVIYTHEGSLIFQPKRNGPVVSIRTLFKPGPPLSLIPGHVLGQGQWSFEGANQALHLKYQGEPQGTFPRTIVSGTGGTLHSQYPLPDRVLQWPAPKAVLPPRTVRHNPCEARLMTLAMHRAQR